MTQFRERNQRLTNTVGHVELLEVTNPSFTGPMHICNDVQDFTSKGVTYIALPFAFTLPDDVSGQAPRMQLAEVAGEPIALGFVTRRGREALEQVMRIDEQDGRIARLRGYAFCPETMRAIGEELGQRVRTGLYRYPTPAPGRHY